MMMFGWLFIGIIVYFIFKEKGESLTNKNNAQTRLKQRFVNGEIEEETYLRMKSIIEN